MRVVIREEGVGIAMTKSVLHLFVRLQLYLKILPFILFEEIAFLFVFGVKPAARRNPDAERIPLFL